MKLAAKQENNRNFKKNSTSPLFVQTLAPGVCNKNGGDAGHSLAGRIRGGQMKNDGKALTVVMFSKPTAL